MKRKKQRAYFEHQWGEMLASFKSFLVECKQDDLHSFRVQIKRLRALFIVLDEAASGGHVLQRQFKPLRKIFKHAGEIRNAHINLKLGMEYKIKNELFENGQRRIIEEGTNDFKLNGPRYLKKINRAHRTISHHLHRVANKDVKRYYQHQLEEIAAALAEPKFNEELHGSRRKIKILVYNHHIAGKAISGDLHFNHTYMDELQGAIGDWHDNVLAIELFSSEELNDKPVVAKIKRRNSKMEKNITALSNNFLIKATSAEEAGEPIQPNKEQ